MTNVNMKRIILSFVTILVTLTACDPDWALNPKNQGWAYIVNDSESDIIFRGYSLFTGRLHTEKTIHPGDTVCVSAKAWDERTPNWDVIVEAGWDPFLATFAQREYMINRKEFNEMHHMVSILTSPDDSISWTLDIMKIESESIFNETNWEKKEYQSEGHFNNFAWYYSFN